MFIMNQFKEMVRKITGSRHHDQMQRFVAPLRVHLSINHFWYYRVTHTGHYSFIGTHTKWTEYCFENHMIDYFPCLRHPDSLQSGISLMRNSSNDSYKNVLKSAWEKFKVYFSFQLLKKIPEGMEGFGFATSRNDPGVDERLLNELPLLCNFINQFRQKNEKIFDLLDDNQVDLAGYLGPRFNEKPETDRASFDRRSFLKQMGYEGAFDLTERELDILKYLASGYPSSYIASRLCLSKRTIENNIAVMKCKLYCHSKVELIQKAQELTSFDLFKNDCLMS